MADEGNTEVQARIIELEHIPGIPIGKRLRVFDSQGQRAVYYGPTPIQLYDISDKAAEAACIAMLSRIGLASDVAIASGFGVHRNTVGRIAARFAKDGMAAVVPAKRGPKGPHKLTPEAMEIIARNAELPVKVLRAKVAAVTGIWVSIPYLYHLTAAYRSVQGELGLDDSDSEPRTTPGLSEAAEEETTAGEAAAAAAEEEAAAAEAGDEEEAVAGAAEEETAVLAGTRPENTVTAGSREENADSTSSSQADNSADDSQERPEATSDQAAFDPPAQLPKVRSGAYMGLALYFPALEATGLLKVARSLYRLPHSVSFGVRAVFSTLFFMTICSRSTLEEAKHLRRRDFGLLIGTDSAPCVKTLRRKLTSLVAQGKAGLFSTNLAQHWVDTGLVHSAYLYVDGHVKAYSGKKKLEEVYDTKAQRPIRGLHSYFVGDNDGRPLLFLTEEISANLAKAMPRIIEAIRDVLGERSFTVIFDRGGYDGKLFSWLISQGVDFITYQRGSVCLPKESFTRHQVRFEGRRLRFWIAEDQKKVGANGPFRRIVVRTKTGHQTPILTSLSREVPPARIAALMFARWRQENFFKYATEHHGLDDIVSYVTEAADPQTMVVNPARKAADAVLEDKRKKLATLKKDLGDVLLDESGKERRRAQGLEITKRDKVKKLRDLEAEIASLVTKRKSLPTHVSLTDSGIHREVLCHEAKAIMDRVKICAYNAEEWMLDRLIHHYGNAHDVRALLRSFAELSGQMETSFVYDEAGIAIPTGITVSLDPPDTPKHREALRGLVNDLNVAKATYPGTAIRVTYRVRVHHCELAA